MPRLPSAARPRPSLIALGLLAGLLLPASVRAQEPLAQARALYNEGDFTGAIAAARQAGQGSVLSPEALLIIGRAQLERYRETADPSDLAAGRDSLRVLQTEALDERGRLELIVGIGEALFLEQEFGAAAGLFRPVLERARQVSPRAGERVLDWWATALDREAQGRPPEERERIYQEIRDRMVQELELEPGSAPASFWLAAAWRGLGRPREAFGAAMAGWLRAPLAGDRRAELRSDLDRLVGEAIVPELAQQIRGDRPLDDVVAELSTRWEELKDRWQR